MKLMPIKAALSAAAICLAFSPAQSRAQEFTHAVRLIVPFAPGGTSDILARLISPKLSEALGQSVVVENKPGAAGNLGADAVAKARPDGHTLLLMDVGSLATAPSLFPDLTYNVEKDLAPIGMVMFGPYVLAVSEQSQITSMQQLTEFAKANPGKLAVATSGVGAMNHITAVQIARGLGIEWKTVPYKGGAAASRAVVSGESQVVINGAPATLPFVVNKQLTGLAVSGEERIKSVPDLPTFKEAGLAATDAGTWQGLLTTAGSPPATVARLNAELQKILAMPDLQAKIAEQGGLPRPGTPDDFKSWLNDNIKSFGTVIQEAGIKIDG